MSLKKMFRLFLASFAFVILCVLMSSCGDNTGDTPGPVIPDGDPERIEIFKDGDTSSEWQIVYSDEGVKHQTNAKEIYNYLVGSFDFTDMKRVNYSSSPEVADSKEILIGATDRQVSVDLVAAVNAEDKSGKDFVWGYCYKDGKLAFYANSDYAMELGWKDFMDAITDETGINCASDLYVIDYKTYEQYEKEQNAEKEAERWALLKLLRAEIAGYNNKNYGELPRFTTLGPGPSAKPIDSHPKVWVNSETLPDVIKNLEAEENKTNYKKVQSTADEALEKVESLAPLGAYDDTKISNYFAAMESLAFMYLVTDEEHYGYAAIYYAFNFIDTVEFSQNPIYQGQHIPSGSALMILAEVYDWCYDLFLPVQRTSYVTGAVNNVGVLMEYSFPPPSNAGGVTGHTTGTTILRNSVAFAIAVADDFPTIYNCIISIVMNNFIEAPNFYYQSGTHHQGTNYGAGKTAIYVYSELLMSTATGTHMYDVSFEETLMSFIYRQRPDGEGIRIGDDYLGADVRYGDGFYKNGAFLASALYGNAEAKAWYMASGAENRSWSREAELTPVFCLIYNDPTIEYTDSDRVTLPLVKFSNAPSTMLIARSAWDDPNAWLTYTNMEEAYAANHDHKDAGTFQIYYKGILAPDAGQYQHAYYQGINQAYGSAYDSAYVKQTISKNGLLVYNPSMSNNGLWTYTGGQTIQGGTVNESGSLADWQHKGTTDQTTVLGKAAGYNSDGSVKYAYVSGDITKAYDEETVDLVMRSTMTLAIGDPDRPMAFIVYDRITSDNKDFKKTFLLHTMEEPIFAGGTKTDPTEDDAFTYVNGVNSFYYTNTKGAHGSLTEDNPNDKYNGKLTLQTLLPENPVYRYVGGSGKHFWVNGQNVGDEGDLSRLPISELGWGRVEMSPTEKNLTDSFLNIMYISDAKDENGNETDNTLVPTVLVQGDTHEGAVAFGNVVMFSKSSAIMYNEFSFTVPSQGDDEFNYYVGGLAEGRWQIKVGNAAPFNKDVIGSEGMLTFSAKTGDTVTVTPIFEKLILVLNGGAFTEYVPAAYYPGEVYTLPTSDITEKYAHNFGGWYDNPDFEGDAYTTIPADETGVKTFYAKWIKAFGVIKYVLNNGNYSDVLNTANKLGEEIILPTDLTKDNCTFEGWYTTSNFKGERVTSIPADNADDWTLYAKFDGPIYYSVDRVTHAEYFLTNDLFGDALTEQSDGIFTIRIDTADKGNTLWDDTNEWQGAASIRLFNPLVNIDDQGSAAYQIFFLNFEEQKMLTYSREVVLMYMNSGDTVDVVFDLLNKEIDYYVNGMFIVTETVSDTSVAPDLRFYNSSMAPYDTSAYKESKHATTPIQLVGYQQRKFAWDTFEIFLGEKVSEKSADYHKITLEMNGGKSNVAVPAGYDKSTGYTLPVASEMFKHGFAFVGWYESDALDGTPVTEIPIGSEGEKTFYAKWEKVFGIISYVMNGGTYDGTLPADNIPGELIAIPTEGVTKPGCEFIGWYDNEAFSGEKITSLPAENSDDITLYAKFEGPLVYNTDKEPLRNIYLLTDTKFGTIISEESNGIFTLRLDTATTGNVSWDYPGNDFLGMRFWNSLVPLDASVGERSVYLFNFKNGNMITNKGGVLISMNSGDTVDIVVDVLNKTLTYYVNGILAYTETEISGFADNLALYDGASSVYDTSLYTDRVAGAIQLIGGYDRRFCCDLIAVYAGENISNAPAGYHKLTLNTDGGTLSISTPAGYYTAEGYVLPTSEQIVKSSYEFLGWYDNPEFEGSPVTSIPAGAEGERTYYAKWRENFGTVSFVLNGGEYAGTLPSKNIADEALALPITGITKQGFIFVGWYDNEALMGAPVKLLPIGDSKSYTLYAKYAAPIYSEAREIKRSTYFLGSDSLGTSLSANNGIFTLRLDTKTVNNISWDGTGNNGIRFINSLKTVGGSKSFELFLVNFKGGNMVTNSGSVLTAMNSGDIVDIVVDCVNETLTYYVNGSFKYSESITAGSFADDLNMYNGGSSGFDAAVYERNVSGPIHLVTDSARTLACEEIAIYLGDIAFGTSN